MTRLRLEKRRDLCKKKISANPSSLGEFSARSKPPKGIKTIPEIKEREREARRKRPKKGSRKKRNRWKARTQGGRTKP